MFLIDNLANSNSLYLNNIGYWRQRADERPSNQEPSVSKTRTEDSQMSLGTSKCEECDDFSIQCSDAVGWATGRASGV